LESARAAFRHSTSRGQPWQRLGFLDLEKKIATDQTIQRRLVAQHQKELTAQAVATRRRAVSALAEMTGTEATEALLSALKTSADQSWEIVPIAARALAKQGEKRAVAPILEAKHKWHSYRSLFEPLVQSLVWLDPSYIEYHRSAWPILAARGDRALLPTDLSYLTVYQRAAIAELLAVRAEKYSVDVLTLLVKDLSPQVRMAAARTLGALTAPDAADAACSELQRLLVDTNVHVQYAAARSLAKIAGPKSVQVIRDVVENPETSLWVMVPLLQALGHTGTPEAAELLVKLAEKYEATVGRHAYRALGDMHATAMADKLSQRLNWHVERINAWRDERDRAIDNRAESARSNDAESQHSADKGPTRPDNIALFELVVALARVEEPEKVFALLQHDLYDVRSAAALGLAVRGQPEIVQRLDELRATSKDPLHRHAFFAAIDMSLSVLQESGNEQDLKALKSLRGRIRDQDGVLPRIDWTIAELEARFHEPTRPTDPTN
jgi:HEAT repeat protein